ncbi:MAG: radical SAM protein [Oscillospiraceae bacterium]|nr:radical SAM protein [Oscillospiraceae bacterium]
MSHSNISVFIPHMGCPHTCSFCNQRTISHTSAAPSPEQVGEMLKNACDGLPQGDAEIAFFGGSFTAIDRDYMTGLLEAASPFVKDGRVGGIRISTRPDCIDGDVLHVLKKYGVTAIELGAQSMDDEVLEANERGHTSEDVRKASRFIREYGFELGLQMMTGLYMSSPEKDIGTARELIALKPDTVRIYPVVILKNTRLGELFEMGEYKPYPFEIAAEICADMLEMFEQEGIRVIKLGLHASETVEADMLGGYYHPAFREICEGLLFRREIEKKMTEGNSFTDVKKFTVCVAPDAVSRAAGHKRSNKEYFRSKGIEIKIKPDEKLSGRGIIVKKDE